MGRDRDVGHAPCLEIRIANDNAPRLRHEAFDRAGNELSRGASRHNLNVFDLGIETWRCLVLLAIESSISAQEASGRCSLRANELRARNTDRAAQAAA
jgi:hypothetical protein